MLKGKYLRRAIYTAFALWLALAGLHAVNAFARTENTLYDQLYQKVSPTDTRIVIIGVDEESIAALGQWPWPRSIMADMVESLAEGGAAAIGIDIEYDTVSRDSKEDQRLAEALTQAGVVVLPVRGLFKQRMAIASGGYMQADDLVVPMESLRGVGLGHVNGLPDGDDVVRKALLRLSFDGTVYPSMALALYETAQSRLGLPDIRGDIPTDPAGRYYIAYTGRAGWFRPLSFAAVYEGRVPLSYFKDKIVLIGMYAHGVAYDWHFTALDSEQATYGVEIHANILQQLLEGRFIRDMRPLPDFCVFALFSLVGAVLCIRLKPRAGLAVLVALLAAYGGMVYGMVQVGIVMQMLYTPLYYVGVYFAALIWHYAQTRAEEARVRGTFGRYMAPSVLRRILEDGEDGLRLGGQRRSVTVLFVDIRGFTPMSEAVEPEDVVLILNEYLDLAASCIHRYGGTLDKFIGDAAMAIWNAPYDTQDHTVAAARAALAMREEAAPLEERLYAAFGQTVRFGIGIHTGEAIIGNIGASFRMDYTAIGDTVNTAARLESNALAGQILLSKEAADCLAQAGLSPQYLGGLRVKGKAEEIDVFTI